MSPTTWSNPDPDDAEFDEDPEGPQECDLADGDEYDTVPCPACGAAISELAECCPRCGEWVVAGGTASRGRKVALTVLALLLIGLLLAWLLGRSC